VTLDSLVRLGLLVSIWLIVLSLGARATPANAVFVLRRPGALARVLGAMFVATPAFALLLAATTPVPGAIKFAIVAMSVGPVPPVLPYKQMKARGEEAYAIGILVAASLASIVLTPPLVTVAARLLGAHGMIGAAQVARTLLLSIGLPLAAGMVLRAASGRAAQAVSTLAQRAGSLLLLVVFAVMVIAAGPQILSLLGNGAVLAIAATVAFGLLVGHLLAGARHRAALALAAATRHPGVALAIAEMSYPDERKPITAAILLYLLITLLVSAPYVRWARVRAAALDAKSV
jgi:BASS family bile acid:Na+ symporter